MKKGDTMVVKDKKMRVKDLMNKYAVVNEDFLLYTQGSLYEEEMINHLEDVFGMFNDTKYLEIIEEHKKLDELDKLDYDLCEELYTTLTYEIKNEVMEMIE